MSKIMHDLLDDFVNNGTKRVILCVYFCKAHVKLYDANLNTEIRKPLLLDISLITYFCPKVSKVW